MAVNLSPVGGVAAQFFDNSGNPLTGGKLYTYLAGSTTPAPTYATINGAPAQPNPIFLDAAGRVPNSGEIWLTDGIQYKFVLTTSTDVPIATYDNILGINSNFVNFTNQQEIQTATAGQTVFNLTTMQYQPGTNSLSVFVDGVNQYGPGAQYAYIETDSDTVTFTSGLHVGAKVKFTKSQINTSASTNDAFQVSYTPPFTGSAATNVGDKLAQTINVKDFGAVGDGVTDDTAAIQAAIDALTSGGILNFENGSSYAIAYNAGANDRWGLKITQSNVVMQGNGATLLRKDSIVTNGYPLVFVGTPDSNVAAATENVTITGFVFEGDNVQHSSSGQIPNDYRSAIYAKNTVNLCVKENTFTSVDSSVIYFQKPGVASNTTNNYAAKFVNNKCSANSHAVVGRALIHAVAAIGIDDLIVDGNIFEWCDDGVASDSTYDLETVQGDTYVSPTLGTLLRSGRGVVVTNNIFLNSSEHPIYLTGFEEIVANNKISSDNLAITATNDAIKIRSYGCTVSGNLISGYGAGISVSAGALNVSVTGNTVYTPSTANIALGSIGVSAVGISAYVAPRIAAGFWSVYRPMTSIVLSGNSIQFPTAAQSPANTRRQMGATILSDTSDANYTQGQIQGLSITNNNFSNYQVGLHIAGTLYRNVIVTGNSFFAKPFTEAGFNGATVMDTRAVIQTLRDSTDQLSHVRFDSNTVYGCKYLCASFDGGGAAGTLQMPWGFSDNKLSFVQSIATSDFVGVALTTKFQGNVGIWFLDRSWGGTGINNSLYSDGATTVNTALRYCFNYSTGAGQMRFYTDDAGTFISF